jgi:hypothetical protein
MNSNKKTREINEPKESIKEIFYLPIETSCQKKVKRARNVHAT